MNSKAVGKYLTTFFNIKVNLSLVKFIGMNIIQIPIKAFCYILF